MEERNTSSSSGPEGGGLRLLGAPSGAPSGGLLGAQSEGYCVGCRGAVGLAPLPSFPGTPAGFNYPSYWPKKGAPVGSDGALPKKISRENFGGELASYLLRIGREYSIATS
jgi:hypothetical protein